jgi:tetratricopeptide (TPR) repeat protein
MQRDKKRTSLFYAESWLLADMLIFSPGYSRDFARVLDASTTAPVTLPFPGASRRSAALLESMYGEPISAIETNLHAWMQRSRRTVPLPAIATFDQQARCSKVDDVLSHEVLPDLLLARDRLSDAEAQYRALANDNPTDPVPFAALAIISLHKDEKQLARKNWQRALDLGVGDASLCFRYAILAEEAGLSPAEIRSGLQKAVDLNPDFDDARYKLALLDNNSGHYAAAIQQLRAMRAIPNARAYGYWCALASAYTETDQRAAAQEAARHALEYATSPEEHSAALRLLYIAATDLTVQMSRDANGNLQMVTARKPHGSNDWNPFIELGDQMRHLDGQIRKVECQSGRITGFRVEGASAAVQVLLPDPSHVLIQGGTPEFVCDAYDGRKVGIDYAASAQPAAGDGVLRGMRFR